MSAVEGCLHDCPRGTIVCYTGQLVSATIKSVGGSGAACKKMSDEPAAWEVGGIGGQRTSAVA